MNNVHSNNTLNTSYYPPFGMRMFERSSNSSLYRYGFNGMEKDDEVAGEGNSYSAEFWQYDSRLGRRWNVDPVVKALWSGYSTFGDNPIRYSDPNGDDWVENGDGDISWDENVTKESDVGEGLTYRGANYTRFENIDDDSYNEVNYNEDKTIESTKRDRPDIDGVVTDQEAIEWYHYGGGHPLTVDVSKFNFKSSDLSVEDFTERNRNALSVNFFNLIDIHALNPDILYRPAKQEETLSDVYGTIRIALVSPAIGQVRLVTRPNGSFDTYDFSRAGTWVASWLRGNGNPTPFDFFGTGTGFIHLTTPEKVIVLPTGPKF